MVLPYFLPASVAEAEQCIVKCVDDTSLLNSSSYCSTSVLGTCESFFCVRIESRIELAVRFDFESNFRIESAVYTSEYLIHSIGIYFVFVTNESDARN